MARFLDFIFGILKWPVALLMLVSLPSLIEILGHFQFNNPRFFAFLMGAVAYIVLKVMAAARTNMSMLILAHELTHIFFALLTFHKVVHIHLNMDESGGAMGFKGKGNWLIVVGPYFFPLFLFFLMLGITYWHKSLDGNLWVNGFLGYFFMYHLESMAIQIHSEQPDFKEVGFPFCWMFLPGANIFICSVILAFNTGGWAYVQRYLLVFCKLNLHYIEQVLGYFTS
jgi:hypothetical protein